MAFISLTKLFKVLINVIRLLDTKSRALFIASVFNRTGLCFCLRQDHYDLCHHVNALADLYIL
jgi:hypothetical protein